MRVVIAVAGVGMLACGASHGNIALELRAGGEHDDLAIVGVQAALTVTLENGADTTISFIARGPGDVRFDPESVTVTAGTPSTVRIIGAAASSEEDDTTLEAWIDGELVADETITVVTGIKLGYSGVFGLIVNNDNGYRASDDGRPFTPCGGANDPRIARATPLACEGLSSTFNRIFVEEGVAEAVRWTLASGNRPTLAVTISSVRTFGPRIDLEGRDPAVTIGTPIRSASASGALATVSTDDCDDDPTTGDPIGLDQGAEALFRVDIGIGDAFAVTYADPTIAGIARIWTTFPSPETAADVAADTLDVDAVVANGGPGCTSPGMTYFDSTGTFRCLANQSREQLLRRHVGFRSMIRRAWANWTSRRLSIAVTASDSLIATLFREAAGDPARAEGFLQLGGYDWFTLTGAIHKGVVSSPGGIPVTFREHPFTDGCPIPTEPDVAFEADPSVLDR